MRQPRTENAPPAASTKSEGLHPVLEIVQSGEAGATVTVPPDGSLDSEARRIVQAVRTRYNVELAVMSGDRALRELLEDPEELTRTIARAWAADGVLAYAVAPGYVDTDMADAAEAEG